MNDDKEKGKRRKIAENDSNETPRMNEQKRLERSARLHSSRSYALLQRLTSYLDRYYLDAALGFAIPGGIGDMISAFFSLAYVYFAAFVIKSLPLTLAILNNTLRDVVLGMIPFYVGDVIDIFHRANKQNMNLVNGFVEGDQTVIKEVNRKAWQSAIFIVLLIAAIVGMVYLLIWLTKTLGTMLFS